MPELATGARGEVIGRYYATNISSVFQPWRTADGNEILAIEAYARSHSKHGEGLSPWQRFADAAVDNELVSIDRLSRTVHALNYFTVSEGDFPLVLNVDARLLRAVPERHGEFFGKVLALLAVPAQRIVIEIRTIHQLDLTRLRQILRSYREHGFAVAVNAEGAIHARSIAELLAPDYLMIDAANFSPADLRRHVAALVGAGAKIAVKRIETEAHAAAARFAGADWVQGFCFDRPSATLLSPVVAAA